ncbi:MAG: TRAP transporter fused permease subunit [Candidatus Nezhaarchaeota archaeon]|nr:TRAP transporter fused permease subunit [Candidatus Nezhaarchaeota archaeon]
MKRLNIQDAITFTCIIIALFQFYTVTSPFPSFIQRYTHLALFLFLSFLLSIKKRPSSKLKSLSSMVLAVASLACIMYLVFMYPTRYIKYVEFTTQLSPFEVVLGLVILFLVLEAARRNIGAIFTGIIAFFLVCFVFGKLLGLHVHPIEDTVGLSIYTSIGLSSFILGISATYLTLFILFGSLVIASGMGEWLIALFTSILGHYTGGPAKVAVVASGIVGMISGSSVANVATTGSFTIPMMKRLGFPPERAGAIECVASTGGLIMPPVMAATAFVLAEFVSKPYAWVCLTAAVPAVLYYIGCFVQVHLDSVYLGIKGLPKEELPPLKGCLKKVYNIYPLVMIVIVLALGYTPLTAAFYGCIGTLPLLVVNRRKAALKYLVNGIRDGITATIPVAIACASCGLIVLTLNYLGWTIKLGTLASYIVGGSVTVLLVITMLFNLLLGMGMGSPTTAYIITVCTLGTALVRLGIEAYPVHMFAFYYSCLAPITPPVALSVIAACGIAGSKFWPTAFYSMRLAIIGFLIPFLFVFKPVVLFLNPEPSATAFGIVVSLFFAVGLAYGVGDLVNAVPQLKSRSSRSLYVKLAMDAACCALSIGLIPLPLSYSIWAVAALAVLFFFRLKLLKL